MYNLKFNKNAIKSLQKLSPNLVKRIKAKLELLAKNPYETNQNVKKLVNRDGYRLRVGDWRIIYEINKDEVVILVLEIDSRGGIYK